MNKKNLVTIFLIFFITYPILSNSSEIDIKKLKEENSYLKDKVKTLKYENKKLKEELQYLKDKNKILNNDVKEALKGDKVLFEKLEVWAYCPKGKKCKQSTKLLYSGKLLLKGKKNYQKQLSKKEMDKIKNIIVSKKLLEKDCSSGITSHYTALYQINYNNKIKRFRFPGCEKELRGIEKIFSKNRSFILKK